MPPSMETWAPQPCNWYTAQDEDFVFSILVGIEARPCCRSPADENHRFGIVRFQSSSCSSYPLHTNVFRSPELSCTTECCHEIVWSILFAHRTVILQYHTSFHRPIEFLLPHVFTRPRFLDVYLPRKLHKCIRTCASWKPYRGVPGYK